MPVQDFLREGAVVRELDATPDGPGAAGGGFELRGQPVGSYERVGVGRGDQSMRTPEPEQPLARGLHADQPGVARSFPRTVQELQTQLRKPFGDLQSTFSGGVRTTVEDEKDLVLFRRDLLLERKSP